MCRVITLALPIGLLVLLMRWITQKQTEREIFNFKIKMETIPIDEDYEVADERSVIKVGLPRVRVDRSVETQVSSVFNLCALLESVNNYTFASK